MTGPGCDLLIIGAGSLARTTCLSLATTAVPAWRVVVAGRRAVVAEEIAFLANARAALAGRSIRFRARALDLGVEGAVEPVLEETRAPAVLLCASQQSPWEAGAAPSAWTALLARTGFGLSLPFQATFAARLARLLQHRPGSSLVNACYPDAVHPVLEALSLPVLCGVGNIQIIAGALGASLEGADADRVRLLAHHVNLKAPATAGAEARAWLGPEALTDVTAHLEPLRRLTGSEMNWITGQGVTTLLLHLLDGRPWSTHLPGPGGLPGGYPVTVAAGSVTVDPPPGWTLTEAVAWNQARAGDDGVVVLPSGQVELSAPAAEACSEAGLIPRPWNVGDLEQVSSELAAVRNRLRQLPPPERR